MRPRAITVLAAAALAAAGCGGHGTGGATGATPATGATDATPAPPPQGHPQVVQPVAGASPKLDPVAAPATAGVRVGPATPALPQPQSVADVRRELARSGMTASTTQATLAPGGLAVAPIDAPAAVQAVIAAGNEIARLPYRYGGGHMTFQDSAYDCSGSISYVFAAAHLLDHTVARAIWSAGGTRGPAGGSRSSPTPATRSCTSRGCASTPSRWPTPGRGGRPAPRMNPI